MSDQSLEARIRALGSKLNHPIETILFSRFYSRKGKRAEKWRVNIAFQIGPERRLSRFFQQINLARGGWTTGG